MMCIVMRETAHSNVLSNARRHIVMCIVMRDFSEVSLWNNSNEFLIGRLLVGSVLI